MGLDGLQLVQAPVQLLQGLDRKADVLVVCNKSGYERYTDANLYFIARESGFHCRGMNTVWTAYLARTAKACWAEAAPPTPEAAEEAELWGHWRLFGS